MSNPITPSSDEIQATGQQQAAVTCPITIDDPRVTARINKIADTIKKQFNPRPWVKQPKAFTDRMDLKLLVIESFLHISPGMDAASHGELLQLIDNIYQVQSYFRPNALKAARKIFYVYSEQTGQAVPNCSSSSDDE